MALRCFWCNFALGHIFLTKLERDGLLVDRDIDKGGGKKGVEKDRSTGVGRLIIKNPVVRGCVKGST